MELYTKIAFPEFDQKMDYKSRATFMGSCFSENIGAWLHDLKFDVSSNLTGISYNPISIANHISRCFSDLEKVKVNDLIKSRQCYVHTDFHSKFNASEKQKASDAINRAVSELQNALNSSDYLFITFGTAIAFEEKSSGEIVNNCHHLPSENFTKTMLNENDMCRVLIKVFALLRNENPKIKIVLTVSPIRHLRHGAIANNRSKARLLKLCETLESEIPECTYLPVYEFVMDELRDYRFYRQDDLIHLNDLGISLIQQKFSDALISKDAQPLMRRVEKWKAMAGHEIQNADSEGSKAFLKKVENEKTDLMTLLPGRF